MPAAALVALLVAAVQRLAAVMGALVFFSVILNGIRTVCGLRAAYPCAPSWIQ